MCPERDRLWDEYNRLLREYTCAVESMMLGGSSACEAIERAQEVRAHVDNLRIEIERHCRNHGCDPEWLKVREEAGRPRTGSQ
jgi:hypothetical protein